MSASSELKACPFCGGTAMRRTIRGKAVIFCTICNITSPWARTWEKAEEAWNTRPHPAPSENGTAALWKQLADSRKNHYAITCDKHRCNACDNELHLEKLLRELGEKA